MLLDHVARYWWLLALRGLLAVIFGVLAVIWPGITLLVLAVFFGAYALIDGIFAVVGAFRVSYVRHVFFQRSAHPRAHLTACCSRPAYP